MSKEFEELVLKKLEKLDSTEKLIQEVVLPKLDKIDSTEKLIQEVVLPKLDALEEKTANTDELIQEVILPKLDKIDVLEEKVNNTDNTLKELSTELKNLNNKFTVFDYEINKKIDSLFDAFVVNTEKDSIHEEEIESLEEKFFNHDIRISNLENKSLTA